MVSSTRGEDYDADKASALLGYIGETTIHKALEDLQRRGVISDFSNSRRKKPGRKLLITDA